MSNYIIIITEENNYVTLCSMGDKDGNLFISENQAYDYLINLDRKGDIVFIMEEEEVPHGTKTSEFILTKKGERYRVYVEEVKKFKFDLFMEKNIAEKSTIVA